MVRRALLPCALLALLAARAAPGQATPVYVELPHPQPTAGAAFGYATAALDWDGDGDLDLAVAARGEGRVYLFLSDGHPGAPTFTWAPPALAPPSPQPGDLFGSDLAAGQLDGDAAQELVVGATRRAVGGVAERGALYACGVAGAPGPIELVAAAGEGGWLGESVVVADLDDDGVEDVAAGAPRGLVQGVAAGKVHVFHGPLSGVVRESVLVNPQGPTLWGNYGHELSTSDANGDGVDDLVVSAIGNSGSGVPVAGEVYLHFGPLRDAPTATGGLLQGLHAPRPYVLLDPWPDPGDLPGPRYGMSVDARGARVIVGANRKDWPSSSGIADAGAGFLFAGPRFEDPVRLLHPTPEPGDLLGIDAILVDLVGDATPDVVLSALPALQPLALLVWDPAALAPPTLVPAPPGAGHHFANGLARGQLVPGGHEELVIGDPTFHDPLGGLADVGRVVVLLGLQ